MENIGWGLQMTVLGMGLVFSLLAMLWGLLTLVLKFDKEPEPVPAEQVQVEAERIAAEADDAGMVDLRAVADQAPDERHADRTGNDPRMVVRAQ